MHAKSVRFPRTVDQDGLYHSVCLTCFRTIAISSNHAVLAEKEWLYSCDGGSPQVSSSSAQLSKPSRSRDDTTRSSL
jgi:hypothetical protein